MFSCRIQLNRSERRQSAARMSSSSILEYCVLQSLFFCTFLVQLHKNVCFLQQCPNAKKPFSILRCLSKNSFLFFLFIDLFAVKSQSHSGAFKG